MRLTSTAFLLAAVATIAACAPSDPDAPPPYEPETAEPPPAVPPADPPPAPPPKPTRSEPIEEPEPPDAVFAEVVYVFMRHHEGSNWMCTGALTSKKTVVTAAHCLDSKLFVSFEIVAPLAPGRPRVAASSPRLASENYDDVANPDIGVLTLERDVVLPHYAELTDVVARVDAGEAIRAAAVVRIEQKAESPLHVTTHMPVSSTVVYGYERGFGTPMFSKGGDSGAPLYLVEKGKPTHKLIGVARQPEPDRNLDHFTRIDAAFLQWFGTP